MEGGEDENCNNLDIKNEYDIKDGVF